MSRDDLASEEIRLRLQVLDSAKTLRSVTEACRLHGITRTQFYRLRRAYEANGAAGLQRRAPIARSHPNTLQPDAVGKIESMAARYPSAGCDRISALLFDEGVRVSGFTVQKYLDKAGLGSRRSRVLALESRVLSGQLIPDRDQRRLITSFNPAFGERADPPQRPGQWLVQDVFRLGRVGRFDTLYIHTVVDAFTQHAFGLIDRTKSAEAAVTLLFEFVMPFYESRDIRIEQTLTRSGREYCGSTTHPYELFLLLHGVIHDRAARGVGYSQRLHGELRREFVRFASRRGEHSGLHSWQDSLDAWLATYNSDAGGRHAGYPNEALSPIERLSGYTSTSRSVP